jgi:GT2 family glycosyltransferase
MNKLGIAVTTKDRPEYFKQCISQLPKVDYVCYVNDGTPYDDNIYTQTRNDNYEVVQHEHNLGIACAKNSGLRKLIQNDCTFLFLIEDDVTVMDPDVFIKYIKAAEASGIWHMNFGFSNVYNFNDDGTRAIRATLDYDGGNSLIFTPNLVAGFQFFHRSVIKNIGYMDERYSLLKNMEHVDHSYKAVKMGLLPAYFWWPDINNSWDYLTTIKDSHKHSQAKDNNFKENFRMACTLFEHKYGVSPLKVPDTSEEEVLKRLEKIQNNYARKFLA